MKPSFYTTHALEHLDYCIKGLSRKTKFLGDVSALSYLRDRIQASVKFLLPEDIACGGLLDRKDALTQSLLDSCKLPYPELVLEYSYMDYKVPEGKEGSTRRVTYCREIANREGTEGIEVWPIAYIDRLKTWHIQPVSAFLPYGSKINILNTSSMPDYVQAAMSDRQKEKDKVVSVPVYSRVLMPHLLDTVVQEEGIDTHALQEKMIVDTWEDLWAMFDFCNIVNCSNIESTTIPAPHKLNKKRAESGKLPMYEYKVLTIKRGHTFHERDGNRLTQDHNSPRQHMRRGHLRHYRDEAGQIRMIKHNGEMVPGIIFIEKMFVGDPALGRIRKDYKVE